MRIAPHRYGMLPGRESETEMNELPGSRRQSVKGDGPARDDGETPFVPPQVQKGVSEPSSSHSHGDDTPITSSAQGSASPVPAGAYQFRGLAARKPSAVRIWFKTLARWLVTVVFIVAVYAVLIGYENYDVMSRVQKRQFSALVTGFLIALALITLSHLTSVVLDLRWWILSKKARSRRKVSYLLRCHSMSQLVTMAFRTRRLGIHIVVAVWLLLLLGSQIGYAALPLCYSVEKTEEKALLRPGNVSIPDLSNIETIKVIKSSNSSLKAEQYTANSYGTISLAFTQESMSSLPSPGTLWYQDDPLIFCGDTSCSYVFHETNPETLRNPDAIPIVASSNRVITATATCSSFRVIEGGNGTTDTVTVRSGAQADDVTTISLPVRGGLDQRTFITHPSVSCGPGCSNVYAFEASATSAWYYNCTSMLGNVTNAVLPQHDIGPELAHLATSAIALQGYETTASRDNNETTLKTAQAVIYPSESTYGVPVNGSVEDMALLISRFTIGVVAITGEANSDIVVAGRTPHLGQKLNMEHWDLVHLIFGLTAGLQLLFALAVTWVMRKLVIPTGGALDEAQIVRAMMRREAGGDGERLGGRNISNEKGSLPSNATKDMDAWIYRSHHIGDGWYDLYMERVPRANSTGQQAETRQALNQRHSGGSDGSDTSAGQFSDVEIETRPRSEHGG